MSLPTMSRVGIEIHRVYDAHCLGDDQLLHLFAPIRIKINRLVI